MIDPGRLIVDAHHHLWDRSGPYLVPRLLEDLRLAPLGLSFDSWCYHTQLTQLIDLIEAFPATRVVVNHVGGADRRGTYASPQDEVLRDWKASVRALAERPNVFVKIGGLNGRVTGSSFIDRDSPPTSEELAAAWKPYVETCIAPFGARRAMFV